MLSAPSGESSDMNKSCNLDVLLTTVATIGDAGRYRTVRLIPKNRDRVKGDHVAETASGPGQTGEDYITPGEAARHLHVSPKTINRWANDGRIPCIVTLGGHRRFRREDVDAAARQMSDRGAAFQD
jgi:excisionase family DNA binding protein